MNTRIPRPAVVVVGRPLLVVPLTFALVAVGLVAAPLARGAQPTAQVATSARTAASSPTSVLAGSSAPTCTAVTTVAPDPIVTTRTCTLVAHASTAPVSWPGVTATANFWSYTALAADPVRATGPVLVVNQNDKVRIDLTNNLGAGTVTGLSIPQLENFFDDTVGASSAVTKRYEFTASRPGTFLYQASGTKDGARQVAMGLVGALVVLPSTPGTAYGSATTAFDDEAVVLLTDLDPALNNAALPLTFDMRNYNPKLHLMNGAPSPATTRIPSQAGKKTLLRVVNAGIVQHALGVLGTTQQVIASSSRELVHKFGANAETVSAGDTADLVVNVPATGGPLYPVYDASTRLDNVTGPQTGIVAFGGALTFLDTGTTVTAPAAPSITGLTLPVTRTRGTTPLTFSAFAGGATEPAVTGAEFVLDNGAAAGGSGTAATVGGLAIPTTVTGSVPASVLGTLVTGVHTLLVRAKTTNGATDVWGAFSAATFTVDHSGATASITLSPSATNYGLVSLGGTATDVVTGGSSISSWTYSVDGLAPTTVTVATPTSIVALSASIATAALLPGIHSVTVTAADSLGNPGTPSSPVAFIVDRTGPIVSGVTVTPSPNDGTQGTAYDPTVVEVKVSTYADPVTDGVASGVAVAEAFLGTTGVDGTGFPLWLYPSGSNPTSLLGSFPVSELTRYPNGPLAVYVHAKDAAGNWGAFTTGSLQLTRTSNTIFASSFDSPTTLVPPWTADVEGTGTNARLAGSNAVTTAPNRAFVITRTVGTFSTTNSRAYLLDNTPTAESKYSAQFTLAPTLTTGTSAGNANAFTLLAARTAANQNAITVEYRGYGTIRQVRMSVLTSTGTVRTPWQTLPSPTSPVTLKLGWSSGAAAAASFTVTGVGTQNLTGLGTSAYTIDTIWFGVSSIQSNGGTVGAGSMWLDAFTSTRTATP